jgi:hypothetical protein
MKKPKLKTLQRKLDRIFSEYIRRRDMGFCCTCDTKLFWKDTDAGHYINRTKWGTKYDESNVHGQCPACNRFRNPMAEYASFMYESYGQIKVDSLLEQSHRTLVEFVRGKYSFDFDEPMDSTRDAYEFLIKHYTEKLGELQ